MIPSKSSPPAHGHLHGHRPSAQLILHHAKDAVEVGSDPVHLVDKGDARDVVLVGLPPDRFRLGLHAANATEYGDGAIQNSQRTFHLDGEVNMARGVDDVDLVLLPEARRRCRGDGDAPLFLLVHPVHGGCAIMNLTHAVAPYRCSIECARWSWSFPHRYGP